MYIRLLTRLFLFFWRLEEINIDIMTCIWFIVHTYNQSLVTTLICNTMQIGRALRLQNKDTYLVMSINILKFKYFI